MIELNLKPSNRELRWFAGLWFPAFWGIVGGLVWYHGQPAGVALGMWIAGAVVGVVGLIWPAIARPIYIGWLCAAYPIGWTVSNLLLLGIYWFVLTPLGLAMRIVRRDPLSRRFERDATTYWVVRRPTDDKERYLRQY